MRKVFWLIACVGFAGCGLSAPPAGPPILATNDISPKAVLQNIEQVLTVYRKSASPSVQTATRPLEHGTRVYQVPVTWVHDGPKTYIVLDTPGATAERSGRTVIYDLLSHTEVTLTSAATFDKSAHGGYFIVRPGQKIPAEVRGATTVNTFVKP